MGEKQEIKLTIILLKKFTKKKYRTKTIVETNIKSKNKFFRAYTQHFTSDGVKETKGDTREREFAKVYLQLVKNKLVSCARAYQLDLNEINGLEVN